MVVGMQIEYIHTWCISQTMNLHLTQAYKGLRSGVV